MRSLMDFSSWQAVLSTLLALAVITLVMVGIRLLVMQTVQQRRERENRQVNERLRTLIAAYKTLGGSFTGDLSVDPTHLADLRRMEHAPGAAAETERAPDDDDGGAEPRGSERRRRIRDAVEAALSDVILLGTEEQVRMAAQAANDMAAGRPVHTAELVVSLRNFIRQVLDLDPVPRDVSVPRQGPLRPSSPRGGSARSEGSGRGGAGRGGGRGGGGGGAGAGAAGGMAGLGVGSSLGEPDETMNR
jgi:uncharacterized membrane protein YgcG